MDIKTPPFRYRDWFDTSDTSDPSTPSTPSDTQTPRFDPLAQRIAAMAPPPPDGPEVIQLEHDIDHEILSRILPHANPQRRSKPCQTTLGTPCARTWDDAWIANVEAAEQRLQHRICGARTMAGTPCELESNHENGRCRFHGGFPLTGAAPGNRNAVIHGLYSRRLRVCDAQCPIWNECPCAGPDVAALSPRDRPTCPYEQTEYNTVLTDALGCAATRPANDPLTLHVAHNIALLQVMMTRAALALRNAPLIDNVTATRDATAHAGAYEMQSPKPSAQLQAFMRIASEFRHFTNMLQPRDPAKVSIAEHLNHTSRTLADTSLDPDHQDLMHPDALTTLNPTQRLMADAIHYAAIGDQPGTLESFRKAGNLESAYEATRANPNNGALYPTANRIAEETVKTLINQMKAASPLQQEMKLNDEETESG